MYHIYDTIKYLFSCGYYYDCLKIIFEIIEFENIKHKLEKVDMLLKKVVEFSNDESFIKK
ncbi:hypothetical protein HMPREF1584_00719 [Gardnerella vaginalis JCP8481A]|nr:hypothetical protein HMPREF1585_01127 [Gardnerella vaginalis JCP8481B]EPI43030.1 hypothetical protein HMPREF1584_00719 [Gardnerella vaginalis JCP8481A]